MNYHKLAKLIPLKKRDKTADKLINIILTSRNNHKMPSALANKILFRWQHNLFSSKIGLSSLLKAAILLEPRETLVVLRDLQLSEIADQVEEEI